MGSEPVEELVEPCAVLPSAGALPNEGGVGRKDDPLAHTSVPLPADLAIVKLNTETKRTGMCTTSWTSHEKHS